MKEDDLFPFHRVWYDKNVNWESYTKIVVAPVDTTHILEAGWFEGVKSDKARDDQAHEIASYLRQKVLAAFRQRDPKNRFQVITSRGPKSLVLELALVEIVPPEAWLNAVGTVAAGAPLSKGRTAIEGRVRDGESGKVIGSFADRRQGKSAIFTAADFTWYSHAKATCDDWANELVAVLNAEEDERVQAASSLTLKPW